MRILLTGCNGNLGSHIREYSSDEIIGVSREQWDNIESYFDDDIDVIIHSAYDLKHDIRINPEIIVQSNLLNTAKLLELAKVNHVKKFIFISSCAVYGDASDTNEEQQCCPVTTNGLIKYLNEEIIKSFCHANNMTHEIYRVFNMYGGNDSFSIIHYIKNALKNKSKLTLNNQGQDQRDFIHVRDVARTLLNLLRLEHGYSCVNIGTGISTKISSLINTVHIKHNNIEINNATTNEVAISCADTARLNSLIDIDFTEIRQYMSTI